MPRALPILLLCASAITGGCTAGLATARIVSAQRIVRDAEDKGAAETAPYEFGLARSHLKKAVEESGDAQYLTSMELADEAKAWATQAILRAQGGNRDVGELRQDVEDLEDEGSFERAPAPTPKPTGEEAPWTPTPSAPAPTEPVDDTDDDFLEEDVDGDEPAPWEAPK